MRQLLLLLALLIPTPSIAADAALLISIIECESSGYHMDLKKISKMRCGDDDVSCGVSQFQEITFYELAQEAGFNHYRQKNKKNKFRWENPIHQLRVMNWALDNGYANRWTCFRKLQDELWEIDYD